MKIRMRMFLIIMIAILGWAGMLSGRAFAGIAHLNTDGSPAIDQATNLPLPPTLTILDATGQDISAKWMPEPGQSVTIQVNGIAIPNTNPTLISSHYPGTCTNFGSDSGDDLTFIPGSLNVTLNQFQIMSNDCGGTVSIQLTDSNGQSYNFSNIPQDSNNNGIPDVWENYYGGNLIQNFQNFDLENPPDRNNSTQPNPTDPTCGDLCREGDGISAFDEYRGFLVSPSDPTPGVILSSGAKHIRTNPLVKDLFVHVVNNQCASTPPPMGTFSRYFSGGMDMFAALQTLVPGIQIHFLGYTPGVFPNPKTSTLWVDYFDSFAIPNTVWFSGPNGLTKSESDVPADRQINKNAVIPVYHQIYNPTTNTYSYSPIQKGVRLIECQDSTPDVLGVSNWGTPNKAGSQIALNAGNSIVFPERIRQDVQTKLANADKRKIFWAIFDPSTAAWVRQSRALSSYLDSQGVQDFLAAKQIQYLVGMELGHLTQLRPSSLNGYHSATGHGSEMDATIQVTMDKIDSLQTTATFYIPTQFLAEDQIETRFKN